jgi:hypothetical protein
MQNAFFVLLYFGVVIAVYVPTVDQWDGVKTNPILDAMCALALNVFCLSLSPSIACIYSTAVHITQRLHHPPSITATLPLVYSQLKTHNHPTRPTHQPTPSQWCNAPVVVTREPT